MTPDLDELNATLQSPAKASPNVSSPVRRPEAHRLLPASDSAEKAALASFLLLPLEVGALYAERGLTSGHFHFPNNSTVYGQLSEMWQENRPIDPITLAQALHDRGLIEASGGFANVSELFTYLPTAANAEHYLEIVLEKATLRRIIEDCSKLVERCHDSQAELPSILASYSDSSGAVNGQSVKANHKTMREHVMAKIHRIENGEDRAGIIATGIRKLDELSPLRRGGMPLIEAETKGGKSILALSIACHVASSRQGGVIYFTLEERSESVIDKATARAARVAAVNHRKDGLKEVELVRLISSLTKMSSWPMTIRDDVYDLAAILAVIRQAKAQDPTLCLAVVDYAQLVRASTRKQDTREIEVAKVSRALRLLSVELDIAIIVPSQINDDGRSRESKALEQDCTAIWKLIATDDRNKKMLAIPRQREGDSQIQFPVTFHGHFASFENFSGNDEPTQETPARKSRNRNQ